jgi:hypothetical protein
MTQTRLLENDRTHKDVKFMTDECSAPLDALIAFIEATVARMIKDKLVLQATESADCAKDLPREMVRILHESLSSARERYLHQCLTRLDKLTASRDKHEAEFCRVRRVHRLRVQKMTLEKEELQQQYEKLKAVVESVESMNSKRGYLFRDCLARREQTVTNLHTFIGSAGATRLFLKQTVADLRTAVAQLKRRQVRMIQHARQVCLGVVQSTMEARVANLRKEQESQIARLQTEIAHEKAEQEQLRKRCKSMLHDVWSITPSGMKHPAIGPDEFPTHVGEVCHFIENVMECERQKAELILKSQIRAELKDIEIDDSRLSISEIIDRYVNGKVAARQKEYEVLLRKGIEREQQLRRKLEEALKKIQELQAGTYTSDSDVLDDMPSKQAAWLEQKRALDETMLDLTQERNCSYSCLTKSSHVLESIDADDE